MNRKEFIVALTEGIDIGHWRPLAYQEFCDLFYKEMSKPEDDIWIEDQSDGRKTKFLISKGKFNLLYLEVRDDILLFTLYDDFTMDMHIQGVAKIVDEAMRIILQFNVSESLALKETEVAKPTVAPKKNIREYYLSKIDSSMINKIDYNSLTSNFKVKDKSNE